MLSLHSDRVPCLLDHCRSRARPGAALGYAAALPDKCSQAWCSSSTPGKPCVVSQRIPCYCYSSSARHRLIAVGNTLSSQRCCAAAQEVPQALEALQAQLPSYQWQETVASGRLLVRPLLEEDEQGAALLLTRAFAGTPEEQSLHQVKGFMRTMALDPPRHSVQLVARLTPSDAALLPPGQPSRVMGTVTLSLAGEEREQFPTLQPPAAQGYLSNMAVDPKFRRQGVARCMLRACEQVTAMGGLEFLYLHARLSDAAALQLYASQGYEEVERDSVVVKLRRMSPRALMRKRMQ